jgi:glycosyltransferase involved in cell wall biosynthesis
MKTPLNLSVIILTYNEEQHLQRCIFSVYDIALDIFIIDSFSTDRTQEIACTMGAKVYQNKWVNYATQFNWALDTVPISTKWILRLDADEVITDELKYELQERLPFLPDDVSGIYVKRRMVFMDKWIRHGDMYPVHMLRLWRKGAGFCEKRWMDEHIKITSGNSVSFEYDIVDHNLNNLNWWVNKHNNYASRETVDLLNLKYALIEYDDVNPALFGTQAQRKRWLKIRYANLPFFIRPFIYFIYRYFLKFGLLDGREGLVYHVLQGFWYRFLVDAKLFEIRLKCGNDKIKIIELLYSEYGIKLK